MMTAGTAVLLPILLSVAIAAITTQQEEQQSVNGLDVHFNQSKQTLKDANKNFSNLVTFSNHRPIYVTPTNISQYRYANNATLVHSQKLQVETPQIYQVKAPRLNQIIVPYENHLRAPKPHQVTSQQQQQQQPRTLQQQVRQSIMVESNYQNNNGSAEQRLFGHFDKHSPNCPNHPPLFPPIGPPCGGVFAGSTVLRHPGFPGPYPASIRCTYSILPRAPTRRACFRVSFVNVALRWSHNCQQDWIQIDQGARLCGGLSGDKYYETPGNLILEFHSGNLPGPERSGFHILVSAIPCHLISPPSPPQHSPPHICPPKPRPPVVRPPPGHQPPGHHPPGHHPPGHHPPGHYPPGNNHPGHPPPGYLPPGRYPPGNNYPEHPNKPPGHHPPNFRPPGHHPPVRPPPIQENHTPFWWRWYRVLKCEWNGIKDLPPGLCPPPHHAIPPSHQPQHPQPYNPPPPLPYSPPNTTPFPPRPSTHRPPPPPVTEMCSRFVASPQFVVTSDEWLSQGILHTQNRGWSCHLSIIKAGPTACEVFLQLENLNLRCGVEFVEVGGQQICGNQPFRQLSVDFRGYEITIAYHNVAGEITPGSFAIRGHQNFDCDPLILDVTPARKLLPLVATTPRTIPTETQKVT